MGWWHSAGAGAATLVAVAAAAGPDYPVFPGDHLAAGRAVWLATCEGCHGYGIAGSPNPREAADWAARVETPRAVLHDHAIHGFFGPDDTYMPPRGGNDALSDDQVRAAVDYMVEFARQTIHTQR